LLLKKLHAEVKGFCNWPC